MFKKFFKKISNDQKKSAQEAVLQDLFYDMYRERGKIYKVNFVRGIFFGLGSVIGGTIIITIAVWVLSLFVQLPVIGGYSKDLQNSIQTSQSQSH